MRTKIKFTSIIAGAALVLAFTGCSIFAPVPTTKFTATIGGQRFSYTNPKQAQATNIVMEVSTNGTARMMIGSIASVNDPAVVDKSYAGQAALVNALGLAIQSNVTTALQGAGTLAGAAAKAP